MNIPLYLDLPIFGITYILTVITNRCRVQGKMDGIINYYLTYFNPIYVNIVVPSPGNK